MKDANYLNKEKKRIYFDNAATTKMDECALNEYVEVSKNFYGNPSQPYFLGVLAKRKLNEARKIIADCINAEPDEIFFTSGGTESDNWALKCFGSNNDIKTIFVSEIEHHAILNVCKDEQERGVTIEKLQVDKSGIVTQSVLENAIHDYRTREKVSSCEAGLVSIMYVNNELGTIQNIRKLAKIAHDNGVLFHTDAVQAVGHLPIDVKRDDIDMLSASAHKFNGPKGIGFLYVKKGTLLHPFHQGGSQEKEKRAGTENVAAICSMAVALKNNVDNISNNATKINEVENYLLSELSQTGLDFIHNKSDNKVPGIVSLSFKGQDGEMLMHRLDLLGISVSTGAACDSKNTRISHVLQAIDANEEYALGTIRISLSKDNTIEEAKEFVEAITKIIKGNN